jgi:hypothetical protein
MKLRHVLMTMEPKYKKKKKYTEDESDLDDDWIAEWEDQLEKKEIEKAEKKFAKDNEKRVEEGEKELKPSELDGRIEEIKDEYARLRKERGTGKATLKRARPVEKVEEAIQKLDERIQTAKLQMVDREEGKEVALGTRCVAFHCELEQDTDHCMHITVKSTILTLGSLPPGVRSTMFPLRRYSLRRCLINVSFVFLSFPDMY